MAGRKKGKWSRRSQDEWRSLLASYDGSGLGVAEFCRREEKWSVVSSFRSSAITKAPSSMLVLKITAGPNRFLPKQGGRPPWTDCRRCRCS